MCKVAIITINNTAVNYGGILQNYSTYNVIRQLGYNPTTLIYERCTPEKRDLLKEILFRIGLEKFKQNALQNRKIRYFNEFRKSYIPSCNVKKTRNLSDKYEYFITGSDQVWNVNWLSCTLRKEMSFLTFTEKRKKVCFAPSFGIDKIPNEWKKFVTDSLMDMNEISVREEAAAKIVEELTGKKAEILIDPTLMLNKEEWNKISKCPQNIDCRNPYILTYFLGNRTEKIHKDSAEYSNKLNANIYNLMDSSQEDLFLCGPREFLYLVAHAKLILTDSFHACVFSFIFGKPFLVYSREGEEQGMFSRINTLLKKFHLERKYVGSNLKNELLECEYQSGYEILDKEQKKVIDFLKKSMNLI